MSSSSPTTRTRVPSRSAVPHESPANDGPQFVPPQPLDFGLRSASSPALDRPTPQRDGQGVRLDEVQQRLVRISQNVPDAELALAEFAALAAQITNADCAVYFRADATGGLTVAATTDVTTCLTRELAGQVQATGAKATRGKPCIERVSQAQTVVAVPVATSTGSPDSLTVVLTLHRAAIEPFLVSLQMVAAHVSLWYRQRHVDELDWEAQASAAIVELVAAVQAAADQNEAATLIANKVNELLGSERVVVGLCRPRSRRVEVKALSGAANFDRRGETVRLMEAALNESVVREQAAIWPVDSARDKHTLLAHRRFAEVAKASFVASSPLQTEDGRLVGACLVIGNDSGNRDRAASFAESASPYLAAALQAARELRHSPRRWAARIWQRRSGWLWSTGGLGLLSLVLALPTQHKIAGQCRLEPASRRYAVAPHNGILEETLVQPGDVVTAGQLLARMDDRELQWELSGLIAERDRAAKKRDASLSQQDIPASQMAQLEMERLQLKIDLLHHQQNNLDLKSAVSGVVLEGTLEDAKGAPVETGQLLFEIAPLNELRLEIGVPEEELAYVAPGAPVLISLDGVGGVRLEGTLATIRPRAEVRDSQNVFVAEVAVENADDQLRPGMSGVAKIVSQRRPLGWILFHRPWEKLSRWLR